jgi:hypothetical protein
MVFLLVLSVDVAAHFYIFFTYINYYTLYNNYIINLYNITYHLLFITNDLCITHLCITQCYPSNGWIAILLTAIY